MCAMHTLNFFCLNLARQDPSEKLWSKLPFPTNLVTLAQQKICTGSNKQKLNTHSSTESELVSADDFLPKLLWTGKLMKAQGFNITSTLFQDNMSTMIIEKRVDALWVSEAMLLMYGFFNEGQRGEKRFEN